MVIRTVIFLFLFKVIISQDYSKGISPTLKEQYEFNPKDFGIKTNNKVTEKDIRHLLKSHGPQEGQSSRIRDPYKYCRSFQTCYECVKSMWYPCNWCHNYGCTDNGDALCPVSSKHTYNGARNLSACPFIHKRTPIFIPSGIRKHIEVKINIPDTALIQKDIICQIKMKNRMTHLKGIILKNVVYCFPAKLVITDGTEDGTFSLLWGGVEPYSNELPLLVYRCDAMADGCEDCRLLPTDYGCGWCEDIQLCVLADKCNDMISWSLNRVTCQFNNKQMYFV